MNKQYKLIKEYPGSPVLDTIIEFNKDAWYAHFLPKLRDDDDLQSIGSKEILSYKEYWQEITKPEYTILSFYRKSDNMVFFMSIGECYGVKYKRKDSSFLYSLEEFTTKSKGTWTEEFEIYQVRRESDGEVFQIGDKVEDLNQIPLCYTIDHIELKDNKIRFYNSGVYFQDLTTIKHFKQPLFTTEDGVDIYENDEFWFVDNNWNMRPNNNWDRYGFSTKEKAEEYILMNKPCLSLNDAFNTITWLDNSKKLLKELVKQKLKQ